MATSGAMSRISPRYSRKLQLGLYRAPPRLVRIALVVPRGWFITFGGPTEGYFPFKSGYAFNPQTQAKGHNLILITIIIFPFTGQYSSQILGGLITLCGDSQSCQNVINSLSYTNLFNGAFTI